MGKTTKRISVGEAHSYLARLLAGVAEHDEYIVERDGEEIVALEARARQSGPPPVSERQAAIEQKLRNASKLSEGEYDALLEELYKAQRAGEITGWLAVVGAWRDVPDEEIDAFLKEIYGSRSRDLPRSARPEQ